MVQGSDCYSCLKTNYGNVKVKTMIKKIMCVLPAVLFVVGCGSSNDNKNNTEITDDLTGSWVSHCHEFTDDDDGSFIAYTIDSYVFTKDSFEQESISYADQACTELTGEKDEYYGRIEVGDMTTLSDGSTARKISFWVSSNDWPAEEQNEKFDIHYVTDGVILNFGDDTQIHKDITYMKQ